jgi:hypothetical protein
MSLQEWKNNELAFEVTADAMETYANKCSQGRMNEGSYEKNLVTSLPE